MGVSGGFWGASGCLRGIPGGFRDPGVFITGVSGGLMGYPKFSEVFQEVSGGFRVISGNFRRSLGRIKRAYERFSRVKGVEEGIKLLRHLQKKTFETPLK